MSNPENPTPDLIARGIPAHAVKVTNGEPQRGDIAVDVNGDVYPPLEGSSPSLFGYPTIDVWYSNGALISARDNKRDQSAVYRCPPPAPVADAGEGFAGDLGPLCVACGKERMALMRPEDRQTIALRRWICACGFELGGYLTENEALADAPRLHRRAVDANSFAKESAHLTREADRYKSALEKERQQRIDDDRATVARFQPVLDAAKGAGWKPGEETIGEFVARAIDERDANDATMDSAAYRSIADRDVHIKRAESERDAALARNAALEAVPLPADLDELDTRLIGVAVWAAHLLPVPTAAGLDVTPEAVGSVGKEMDAARAALRSLSADRGRLRDTLEEIENDTVTYGNDTDGAVAHIQEIARAALADRGGK